MVDSKGVSDKQLKEISEIIKWGVDYDNLLNSVISIISVELNIEAGLGEQLVMEINKLRPQKV